MVLQDESSDNPKGDNTNPDNGDLVAVVVVVVVAVAAHFDRRGISMVGAVGGVEPP